MNYIIVEYIYFKNIYPRFVGLFHNLYFPKGSLAHDNLKKTPHLDAGKNGCNQVSMPKGTGNRLFGEGRNN